VNDLGREFGGKHSRDAASILYMSARDLSLDGNLICRAEQVRSGRVDYVIAS
jgi:hypothetical protein